MKIYTIVEELMHSQFKDADSTLTKELLMKFINPKLDNSSKRVLKAYGLSDLDGDLTNKQLEELLMLLARSSMGDPNLAHLLHPKTDNYSDYNLTELLNTYIFEYSPLISPGSLTLGTVLVFTTEELMNSLTEKTRIDPDNQPCK